MKKLTKLVYGLSACLLLTLVGCNNETEDSTPKAVAEKVSVATVEVPAEVIALVANNEVTVVSEESKADVEAELKDSLSAEALSEMFSSFGTDNDELLESARNVSVEDLENIINEFSQEMENFTATMNEKGNASMHFSKTPGTVTGLPEGIEMSIPVIFYDMKATSSVTQTKATQGTSIVVAAGASASADLSKVEGFEDFLFKNVKANLAVNGNSVVKLTMDMSDCDSGNYETYPGYEYSGNVNYDCSFSVGGVFVTKNKVAGKLLATTDISVKVENCDSISALMKESTLDEAKIMDLISEYVTTNFKVAAYDFEGNEIFSLIDSNDVDEISDYIELEVLLEQFMSEPDYE